MSTEQNPSAKEKHSRGSKFSLDAWAVTLALALSLLVWMGLLKHVPW
jgi:hypothetical protein